MYSHINEINNAIDSGLKQPSTDVNIQGLIEMYQEKIEKLNELKDKVI